MIKMMEAIKLVKDTLMLITPLPICLIDVSTHYLVSSDFFKIGKYIDDNLLQIDTNHEFYNTIFVEDYYGYNLPRKHEEEELNKYDKEKVESKIVRYNHHKSNENKTIKINKDVKCIIMNMEYKDLNDINSHLQFNTNSYPNMETISCRTNRLLLSNSYRINALGCKWISIRDWDYDFHRPDKYVARDILELKWSDILENVSEIHITIFTSKFNTSDEDNEDLIHMLFDVSYDSGNSKKDNNKDSNKDCNNKDSDSKDCNNKKYSDKDCNNKDIDKDCNNKVNRDENDDKSDDEDEMPKLVCPATHIVYVKKDFQGITIKAYKEIIKDGVKENIKTGKFYPKHVKNTKSI